MKVKVLIIRFSSIGDIVLTTPVIRCIKQQLNNGDVELHYLSKKQFEPILHHNPYIDKLICINEKVSDVVEQLKNEGYDYVFDLHKNVRSMQVKRALKVLSFSFEKLNIEKWVYVNFGVNRLPDVHIVDRYMDTTKAFGIVNDNKGLDYFIPKEDEIALSSLPSDFQNGFVAYAIGGQHQGKIVPTHKIVAMCDGIQLPLVLLGGKEDSDRGEQIAHQTNNTVLNACGKYNLNQSASLLKQAQVVITHDTGLMHIASAFKKKIISIWGATVPAFGMYPYLPGEGSVIVIPKGEKHKPYSKLGNKQWHKAAYKGMERIDVEDVIAIVNEK